MSDFNTFYRPRPFLSLLDTKRQVWRKLSPAAEGNPPRLISFLETIKATLLAGFHLYFAKIFLLTQKSFREVISPQIFPFGKSSQKSYDSLSHLR